VLENKQWRHADELGDSKWAISYGAKITKVEEAQNHELCRKREAGGQALNVERRKKRCQSEAAVRP
jgi:hypothetical protein